MNEIVLSMPIWATSTDPIHIGTGGYSIGRVDNTIVRDPITKIPKIPGTSFAGTWRYYMALYLQSLFANDEYRLKRKERRKIDIKDLFRIVMQNSGIVKGRESAQQESLHWVYYEGNRYAAVKCAGQDESPMNKFNEDYIIDEGHCGNCIICKGFGFSKKDLSWQGMLFFSDLNILLFPIHTRLGVKWIASEKTMMEAGLLQEGKDDEIISFMEESTSMSSEWLNVGWLNLPYKIEKYHLNSDMLCCLPNIGKKDICIVPDSLVAQIINSNLEVRTSVSIDPLTGTAKDTALFTSEAIPRATVFYGSIRIFDKSMFVGYDSRLKNLPTADQFTSALKDTGFLYETLGIGGMTTRGFGRLRMDFLDMKS